MQAHSWAFPELKMQSGDHLEFLFSSVPPMSCCHTGGHCSTRTTSLSSAVPKPHQHATCLPVLLSPSAINVLYACLGFVLWPFLAELNGSSGSWTTGARWDGKALLSRLWKSLCATCQITNRLEKTTESVAFLFPSQFSLGRRKASN